MDSFKICDENSCSGCSACLSICPQDAIFMTENLHGSTIPKINMKKCIACNACRNVCPNNRFLGSWKRSDYAYAVWSEDKDDIAYSSSGGAAAVFSRYIVRNGGVVFGAASIDGTVKHIRSDSESELGKLRGSKYVQSQIGDTYRLVKREVLGGKSVLFIGTPCQIAGLRNFLGKEYENLLMMDLICHGTPPEKYLQEHIHSVVGKKKWNYVAFRGEKDFYLTVLDDNRILYQQKADEDMYFRAFLDGLIFRENCYQCQYACPDRVSDITIGDFWGLDRTKLIHPYMGKVSLVLLNSEKGEKLFNSCMEAFVWEKRDICEALNPQQGNLLHPSDRHSDRNIFLDSYPQLGFTRSVKKTRVWKIIRNERIKKILGKYNLKFIYRIMKPLNRFVKNGQ